MEPDGLLEHGIDAASGTAPPTPASFMSKEFAPGGALGGRDADLVGAVIVSGVLGLTMIVAARAWIATSALTGSQIASLAGAPIYVLAIIGFLTRDRVTVPPVKGEFLVPLVSAVSPAVALNISQFVPAQWGSSIGYVLAAIGILLSITALASLRRSFAVLPAVRRIVRTGPYRVVRHPLYLGETLYVTGFVLLSASWANLVGLAVVVGLLAWRVLVEERKLRASEQYVEYSRIVRYRFLPWIW